MRKVAGRVIPDTEGFYSDSGRGVQPSTRTRPSQTSYGDAVNVLMLFCIHHWFNHLVIFHFYLRFSKSHYCLICPPILLTKFIFVRLSGFLCSIVVG